MGQQGNPTPHPRHSAGPEGLYEQPFPVPGLVVSEYLAHDVDTIVGFIDADTEAYGVAPDLGATVIDLAARRAAMQPLPIEGENERFAA